MRPHPEIPGSAIHQVSLYRVDQAFEAPAMNTKGPLYRVGNDTCKCRQYG